MAETKRKLENRELLKGVKLNSLTYQLYKFYFSHHVISYSMTHN